jgi:two-component system sensor histidine kinase PilS (NtrC family)
MSEAPQSRFRPSVESQPASLWILGAVRMVVLVVVAVGACTVGDTGGIGMRYLVAFYGFGFACGLVYLVYLLRTRAVSPLLTGGQILVDFGVVAATVSFTGGPESFFTFLFVVVILEAGLLLGVFQSFLFATLAAVAMFAQALEPSLLIPFEDRVALWYNYIVQALAFNLTASISGYWNQRVRHMQQFQHEILDNLNNGFLIADRNGVIASANRAAHAILDLPPNAALGRRAQDLLRMQSGDECPILTALRLDRDYTSYEFHVLTESGAVKLLGLTTSRIRDARGHPTGIIASFSDLTEMAHMRQELQRQDRLAVIGELAAGLAHEIRNPVAAIRGAVDELQANLDQRSMALRLAAIAIRESDHLNQIVSGFLDFARRPSMCREPFDVSGLVEEVADQLRRKYGDAVEIRTDFPDRTCAVSGDRSQIKQVFVNIARNGIEAMQERGTLTMRVKPRAGSVEIIFEDEGPGIDPDKTARIFDPFYTTKEQGVGMGLAICLRIVTAHDGTIRVGTRSGGGTAMCIRMPEARGAVPTSGEQPPDRVPAPEGFAGSGAVDRVPTVWRQVS